MKDFTSSQKKKIKKQLRKIAKSKETLKKLARGKDDEDDDDQDQIGPRKCKKTPNSQPWSKFSSSSYLSSYIKNHKQFETDSFSFSNCQKLINLFSFRFYKFIFIFHFFEQ